MISEHVKNKRYLAWQKNAAGAYAFARINDMLRVLLSGWPRRSRSVLVFNAGGGNFLESLWQAGFDVTAQDDDQEFLDAARELLGSRAEFVLSTPEHLPFDNCSFDYAVAACAFEFWKNPVAVLEEIKRLACSGAILIIPSAWSMFGLECRLRKKSPLCAPVLPLLQTPWHLHRLVRHVYGKKKTAWASVLPTSSRAWTDASFFRLINSPVVPLPLGAFVGLRIDFGPLYTGTPLIIRSSAPVPTAK